MTTRRVRSAASLAIAATVLSGWSFFDPFHEHVEKGNRRAKDGDVDSAVGEYEEAAHVRSESPIPDFNSGVALARKGDAAAARDALLGAAASEDPAIAADALYNLGNVYLAAKQPAEAVNAYLESLDLDPDDPDARRNLELALRLQEQQQQQKQQQPSQEQERGDEEQDSPQKPEEPPSEKPEPQPEQPDSSAADSTQAPMDRLSREDAERLLQAIQAEEMKLLERMQKKEPTREVPTNDW